MYRSAKAYSESLLGRVCLSGCVKLPPTLHCVQGSMQVGDSIKLMVIVFLFGVLSRDLACVDLRVLVTSFNTLSWLILREVRLPKLTRATIYISFSVYLGELKERLIEFVSNFLSIKQIKKSLSHARAEA